MAKKKKYYVVWAGNNPGIYDSWTDCQLQIKGYPNARYKSFTNLEEAKAAYGGQYDSYVNKKSNPKRIITDLDQEDIIWDSLSVDAACSGNPGIMEYRGVDTKTGDEIFHVGPFRQGTNNIGEFLALVHGLAYLKQIGQPKKAIYSDSRIAMGWVVRKTVKTTVPQTAANKKMFQLIYRGIKWLKENRYENPILKWETKRWGEIPADFGRK